MTEPIYVIGYARVSTPKQAQNGESLEDQEIAIKKYCKKMGWSLFPDNTVFKEPYTGTKKDRPVYTQILGMLKTNKKALNIKYFVFWDFDRLTRAGTIDYDQIWNDVKAFGVKLRDTTEVIQDEKDAFEEFGFDFGYDWAVARPSEDTEREKVEDARKERIKILKRLIKPQIRLTQEGYHIGRPDYGFRNKKILVENKKKCIQERYEPEAVFVERFYKLRADNVLTDEEICDDLNAIGYKSSFQNLWGDDKTKIIGTRGGKKLTPKHLQAIIGRYSYCGVICEKWTKYQPIKAKYAGLVTVDIWNKANRGKVFLEENSDGTFELSRNVSVHSKKRKKYNPTFPFKGVLMCEVCGSRMKASASTGKSGGRFGAYHCERGHPRNAFPQKEVEKNYNIFLDNIKFTDKFLTIFEKSVYFQFRKKEGELSEYAAKANINVADLQTQKSALIKSFPTATIKEVRDGIEEEITKIQKQIEQAQSQRDKNELEELDVTNFIKWCRNIMEHPKNILADIRSEQELIHMFSLFFVDFPTYTQIVSGTPKMSLVFNLSEQFKVDKSVLVTLQRIEL
jgi:site-specific DNA recombinase